MSEAQKNKCIEIWNRRLMEFEVIAHLADIPYIEWAYTHHRIQEWIKAAAEQMESNYGDDE